MFRDRDGTCGSTSRDKGGLAKVDPKTEKIRSTSAAGMSPTGGAVTVDIDNQASSGVVAVGALRFDPKTRLHRVQSLTYKTPQAPASPTARRRSRRQRLVAEMQLDIVGAPIRTRKVTESSCRRSRRTWRREPEEKKFYDGFTQPDFNAPFRGRRAARMAPTRTPTCCGRQLVGHSCPHRHQERRRVVRALPARCSRITSRSTASTTPGSTSG